MRDTITPLPSLSAITVHFTPVSNDSPPRRPEPNQARNLGFRLSFGLQIDVAAGFAHLRLGHALQQEIRMAGRTRRQHHDVLVAPRARVARSRLPRSAPGGGQGQHSR